MIDLVYYNDYIRCYRDGVVERLNKHYKPAKWTIVKNTANHSKGYNQLKVNKKLCYRQRLIAYCFLGLNNIIGESGADDCIDHKNGIPLDNRVANLRITTQQGNNQNTPAKGYTWCKKDKKWRAQITLNGKQIYLGYYNKEEEAHQAYLEAKLKYHIIYV